MAGVELGAWSLRSVGRHVWGGEKTLNGTLERSGQGSRGQGKGGRANGEQQRVSG